MAEQPNTPVTPAPIITPPTQSQAPPAQPVTSQPAPQTQNRSNEPTLEAKQTAETIAELTKLFDAAPGNIPAPTDATPPIQSAPSPKPDEKPGTPVGTDDFQNKLDAIKPAPGAHPNVASGMEQLKKEAKAQYDRATTLETQLKEYQTKVQEYEAKLQDNKLPEPIEKELNELRTRVREFDYKADPEFQKTYVAPVQKAEQEIVGLLKQAGLTDDGLKQIQANGGIINMSQSGEEIEVDGKTMTMAEWVDSFMLGKTPGVLRTRIQGKLSSALDLIEKGRSEIEDFRANSTQRHEARMKQMNEEFESGTKAALSALGDLAKPITITNTMSAEEQQAATEHNNLLKQSQEKFQNYLKVSRDPKTAGEVLAKATQADMLLTLYQRAQETIKALQGKLNGIKAAGSHSAAGDHTPPPGPEKPSMSTLLKTRTEDALGALFNAQPTP